MMNLAVRSICRSSLLDLLTRTGTTFSKRVEEFSMPPPPASLPCSSLSNPIRQPIDRLQKSPRLSTYYYDYCYCYYCMTKLYTVRSASPTEFSDPVAWPSWVSVLSRHSSDAEAVIARITGACRLSCLLCLSLLLHLHAMRFHGWYSVFPVSSVQCHATRLHAWKLFLSFFFSRVLNSHNQFWMETIRSRSWCLNLLRYSYDAKTATQRAETLWTAWQLNENWETRQEETPFLTIDSLRPLFPQPLQQTNAILILLWLLFRRPAFQTGELAWSRDWRQQQLQPHEKDQNQERKGREKNRLFNSLQFHFSTKRVHPSQQRNWSQNSSERLWKPKSVRQRQKKGFLSLASRRVVLFSSSQKIQRKFWKKKSHKSRN